MRVPWADRLHHSRCEGIYTDTPGVVKELHTFYYGAGSLRQMGAWYIYHAPNCTYDRPCLPPFKLGSQ